MKKKMMLGAFVASLLMTSCASYEKTAPIMGITGILWQLEEFYRCLMKR